MRKRATLPAISAIRRVHSALHSAMIRLASTCHAPKLLHVSPRILLSLSPSLSEKVRERVAFETKLCEYAILFLCYNAFSNPLHSAMIRLASTCHHSRASYLCPQTSRPAARPKSVPASPVCTGRVLYVHVVCTGHVLHALSALHSAMIRLARTCHATKMLHVPPHNRLSLSPSLSQKVRERVALTTKLREYAIYFFVLQCVFQPIAFCHDPPRLNLPSLLATHISAQTSHVR